MDASVVAKWLFQESDTDKATALLHHTQAGRLTVRAPTLLSVEIASALSKRVLCGLLSADEALWLYDRFQVLCPFLEDVTKLAGPALRLAIQFRHSAYDCLYVALAQQERCALLTANEKMFRVFSGTFVQVLLLSNWS